MTHRMAAAPQPLSPARLRQRRQTLLARLALPPDALPGSLALTHRRCGKPSCHCADSQGHPLWSLTFMDQRRKRVERIPDDWVDSVHPRVEAGRKFKETVAELFAINAQLLVAERRQQAAAKQPSKTNRK